MLSVCDVSDLGEMFVVLSPSVCGTFSSQEKHASDPFMVLN